jgi:plastocyanin
MPARSIGVPILVLLLASPLAAALPLPVPVGTVSLAVPGSWLSNYVPPAAAATVGGALTLINLDIQYHDFVADQAYGPDSQPWCVTFRAGSCPLFWSPLIATGETTSVLGLENLVAGQVYQYYCTIHPPMRGSLVALPALPVS